MKNQEHPTIGSLPVKQNQQKPKANQTQAIWEDGTSPNEAKEMLFGRKTWGPQKPLCPPTLEHQLLEAAGDYPSLTQEQENRTDNIERKLLLE